MTASVPPPPSASTIEAGAGLLPVAAPVIPAGATVLTVGVGKEFATVGAAVAAAQNGDIVLVDAGTYTNDFADVTADITIEGVGGMVNMVATEPPTNLKGIITADDTCTIENMSFSGAAIDDADGGNGAGIRYEGGAMTLVNDQFSHNQDGVMGTPVIPTLTTNTVSITHCVFSDNGSGSGYTHNLYIGDAGSLTATDSVFEGAVVGHELKSRAMVNVLQNNVFSDGPTGTASYDIDLPDGGNDLIQNNVIEKGPDAENDAMVHFGGEGIPYAGSALTVQGNDFVDDLGTQAVGVLNQTAIAATITGNSFANLASGNILQGPGTESGNVDGNGAPITSNTLTGVLPGSTLIITDALAHTVTLSGTLNAVEGGAGLLTVIDPAGHVVVIGGSGGMVFTEGAGAGGSQITTQAGSSNTLTLVGQDLIDSQGRDTIVTGMGNVTGQVTGNAVIQDGSGNNQWAVLGTATIDGTGSNPVVSVGVNAQAIITGPLGYLEVQNNGGTADVAITQGGAAEQVAIIGGAVDMRVYSGAMNITTASGTQGTTLDLGAGTALVTSQGADVIHAGSGDDTVIVSARATIYAGSGALSVFGRGDSLGAVIYGNGGTYDLNGDTGNITYDGGAKANMVDSVLSNDTLVGGAGCMTVMGGSREAMIGGMGGLIYQANDGGGADSITTAAGASDTLTLAGADTVVSRGNDQIFGGSGNQTIAAYGTTSITGSTGNSRIDLYGQETLNGVGNDTVTVHQGAVVILRAGTGLYASEQGAKATVVAQGAPNIARVVLNGGQATAQVNADRSIGVVTTQGTATQVGLTGGVATVQSNGSDTIDAWSGTDTIDVNAANVHIWGGAAALTVHDNDPTNGDAATIYAGSGSIAYDQGGAALRFAGGSGTSTLNGGWGSMTVSGGSGQMTVNGGSGGLHFVGGSGSAVLNLTAGAGAITFGSGSTDVTQASYGKAVVYSFLAGHGGGTDIISGFRVGTDSLDLHGVTVASQSVAGGSTGLLLSDNTHIQLLGVAATGAQLFG